MRSIRGKLLVWYWEYMEGLNACGQPHARSFWMFNLKLNTEACSKLAILAYDLVTDKETEAKIPKNLTKLETEETDS